MNRSGWLLACCATGVLACLAVRGMAQTSRPDAALLPLASPAKGRCAEPRVVVGADGRVYMTWIRRAGGREHVLEFSRLDGRRWTKPRTIAAGRNWFVNWADFPSLAVSRQGVLAAHWLERSGKGTYAYGVRIACSRDGGKTWLPPFWLHTDRSATEHGFASLVPIADERFLATWLDGRAMARTGNMTLRSVTFGPGGTDAPERVLDARVCECCATAAASTSTGVLTVFRDRSETGVRDISLVRRPSTGSWSRSRPLHRDGWRIPG